MTNEKSVNYYIGVLKKSGEIDTNLIRDGYHSFGELYEHRIELFIALCRVLANSTYKYDESPVWRKPVEDGWFLMGIEWEPGKQIAYHLPESRWKDTEFASYMHKDSYQWDGHTSADVLERLKKI